MKKPDDMTERDRLCIAITARGFAWSPKESTARLRKRYEKMVANDPHAPAAVDPLKAAEVEDVTGKPWTGKDAAHADVPDGYVKVDKAAWERSGNPKLWYASTAHDKWSVLDRANFYPDYTYICRASDVAASPVADHIADAGKMVAAEKPARPGPKFKTGDAVLSAKKYGIIEKGQALKIHAILHFDVTYGQCYEVTNPLELSYHPRMWESELRGAPAVPARRFAVGDRVRVVRPMPSNNGLVNAIGVVDAVDTSQCNIPYLCNMGSRGVWFCESELDIEPAPSAAPFRMPEFTKRCDAGWYTIKGFAAKNTEFRGVHVSELDALSAELARLTAENAKLERAIESWKRSEELWEEREKGKDEENASLRARVAELEKAVDSQGMPKDITGPELAHVIKANNERVTSLESALAAAREESRNRQIALRSANNTIEKARKAFVVFAVEKFRESLTEEVEAEYPTIPDPTEVPANGKS